MYERTCHRLGLSAAHSLIVEMILGSFFFLLVVGFSHINVGHNPACQTLPHKHECHKFSTRRTWRHDCEARTIRSAPIVTVWLHEAQSGDVNNDSRDRFVYSFSKLMLD